jgi:hypothetical protein
MPTTEQDGQRPSIEAEREAVRFLSACRRNWHAHFAALQRRAQAEIVTYLCTRGRGGAAVGELHGVVKQLFLLDDSTVKERIQEIGRLGLCRLEPEGEALSTRSIVLPTSDLLAQFDRYLHALGEDLLRAGGIAPAARGALPAALASPQRAAILEARDAYAEPWREALERIFEAQALSRARRMEAVRQLHGVSHGTLLHMAIEHRYGVSALAGPEEGILADQMAAALLALTGQNFQTTRDHIGHLLTLGLLERRPGRSLRVALAASAAPLFASALSAVAARLPALARELAGDAVASALPAGVYHYLVVVAPGMEARRVPVLDPVMTIGRLAPCDLLLPCPDVSRRHCRLELAGGQLRLSDLGSTNGTLVDGNRISGTVTLRPGAKVRIGSCELTYEREDVPDTGDAGADDAERTLRRSAEQRRADRNETGNSAS